jgi:iron complex transport system substrate-binding protein
MQRRHPDIFSGRWMFRGLACWLLALAWIPTAAAELSVEDDFGRTVTLPQPARRIVSLAPHNTENAFSAGAGSRLVGVVDFSDYPPQAASLPSVGSSARVNIEAVIALEPDLVLAWETGSNREALRKLADLGYAVYYSEPRNFEDVIRNIEEIALLSGTPDRIEPPAEALREELAALRSDYGDRERRSVFYQVWSNPLMTLNGDHIVSRALELCGAFNLFGELPIIAPRVSVEAVVEGNPDIIITGSTGSETDLSVWDRWTSITAVNRGHYVYVDADVMHRHTARMIQGIRHLCEQIDATR